jgi:hypothetical protein
MLNAEYYKEKIKKVGLAFGFVNGEIVPCSETACNECDFQRDVVTGCSLKTVEWLISECKEPVTLTAKEKHFAECLIDGFVARDKNNDLYWFKVMPEKTGEAWMHKSNTRLSKINGVDMFSFNPFPFIKWEDEEPWAVSELRKLPALEYNPEDVAFKGGEK